MSLLTRAEPGYTLVTGATSTLGAEIAHRRALTDRLLIHGRDPDALEELAIELLDNTTDQPSSYYSGSLKKLNAEEAALIKAEIEAEMNDA